MTDGEAMRPTPDAVDTHNAPASSQRRMLPARAPLSMPEQDFDRRFEHTRDPDRRGFWIPRAAIAAGALLITAAFGYELHEALATATVTPVQIVFLILSTMAFGWIAFGTLSAAFGFLPLFAGENADTLELPKDVRSLRTRTALLFPVYHEAPAPIAGAIEAMAAEIKALGHAQAFHIFILSDTRGDATGAAEKRAYVALRDAVGRDIPIYYRRRKENAGRKAGNIKDWVENFGQAYANFIILDADSVMSGETLARLAAAMEDNPKAGLIQTVPKLTGGKTLLQKLQQFAADVYGPCVSAGLAFWQRDQGNYWGHNAVIRTAAFAGAAGLPSLPGDAPFGGHIQSHDFVEAVLLQRAGWGVHMVPTAVGSYEGLPPNLINLVQRDRRWAQGNLQHLGIVSAAGLTPMGRLHLIMGALAYLVSMVWAASLIVGIILALQSQQVIPSYFTDQKTLFPIWPIIDPGAALRLFLATFVIVLLPKVLGLVLVLKRTLAAHDFVGALRTTAGVLVETFFSILLAPILMATQTVAIIQICLGRDSGWSAQQRSDGSVTFGDAVRFHWRHMVIGLATALVCWFVSWDLVAWMSPVIAGLVLAAPISWFTARRAGPLTSAVLNTPEDRSPPPILNEAHRRSGIWADRMARAMAAPEVAPASEQPRSAAAA